MTLLEVLCIELIAWELRWRWELMHEGCVNDCVICRLTQRRMSDFSPAESAAMTSK
jgi:hypothetical protein